MKVLHKLAFLLLIVGGLNWLLIGVWDWNLVASWLSPVETWVYVLVGLSALYELFAHSGRCKECMK